MGNQVNFEPTKFENVRSGDTSMGFRAYDDYGQTYGNTFESIPDDDLEFLQMVKDSDDENVSGILDYLEENEEGCMIGGTWYDWEEIKDVIES